MGLFGGAKTARAHGVEVSLSAASGGRTTVSVDGKVYGIITKGRQQSDDRILVNSSLTDDRLKAEALVALMGALDGSSPEDIAKLVARFRTFEMPT